MTDAIKNIDRIISNMSNNSRIIYLKSERREIAEIVFNESEALRGKLEGRNGQLNKQQGMSWFRSLTKDKHIMRLTDVYEEKGLKGRIALQKDASDKKIVPMLLYVTDFQVFPQKSQAFMLKAFLDCGALENAYLLIASPMLRIPDGFGDYVTLVNDTYISMKDIRQLLTEAINKENVKRPKPIPFSKDDLDQFAKDFVGLSEKQVYNVLERMSPLCTGLRDKEHLTHIQDEKKREIEKDPTVSFIEVPEKETVCGLGNYSTWLDERKSDFLDPIEAMRMGTPAPKGVLLCGVPGTGKTAAARETARRLGVPLIKFDISRIQTKDFGGSEERLRRYLDRISAFGSCVMLMDEIEKVFSVDEGTHEVKMAMLGLLLDWMQTRKANVFTFITANNISKLPPELLRDGRISGRFFAFMPSRNDLCEIIQLKLRSLVSGGLFDSKFCALLENKLQEKNPFAEMLDEIAKEAKKNQNHRTIFMTGANIESLIEMTNREMRNRSSGGGYRIEDYIKVMKKCALSDGFVPQGQSNMKDIVDMWLAAQERQYQDVSANSILPFVLYKQDGTFTKDIESNDYDDYMREVLKARIKKKVEDEEMHKNFVRKHS